MSGVGVGAQLDKATQALDDARVGSASDICRIKRIKLRRVQDRELWEARKPAPSRGRTASSAILVLIWLVVVTALSGDGLRI